MTKADIVEQLYERVGISKEEAARITELFLDIMKEALEKGETVKSQVLETLSFEKRGLVGEEILKRVMR